MGAEALIKRALRGWGPKDTPETYRAFSSRLRLPSGPLEGNFYDPSSDPVQSYVIDQLDNDRWTHFAACAPPQVGGKTQTCILTPALRSIISARKPVGYALPTLQDLNKAWEEKLKPAITKSGYADYLPQKGPGSKGGRGPTLTLHDPVDNSELGRFVFFAGATYSSTVMVLLVDEVDQFRKANGEPLWEILDDMAHRCDSYGDAARRIYVGTIEHDERSIILTMTDQHGTGTRGWPQCPHCGRWTRFDWTTFEYDPTDEETARATAHISCTECGSIITEEDRQRALRTMKFCHRGQVVDAAGNIIGDTPRTRKFGIVWTALESSLSNMAELAADHLKASQTLEKTGEHGLMRKFVRYRKCELYTDDIDTDEGEAELCSVELLVRRARKHGSAPLIHYEDKRFYRYIADEVPEEVERVALGCDVQANRVYWAYTGLGEGDRTLDLGYGCEYLGVMDDDRQRAFGHGDLSEILDRITEIEFPLPIPYDDRVIDTRYDPADKELTEYLKANRAQWRGVVGHNSLPKSAVVREPGLLGWDPRWKPGLGRFCIATHAAQQRLHAAYIRSPDSQSAALPARLDRGSNVFIRHICGMQWVDGRWKELNKRHDFLDCRVYSMIPLIWSKKRTKKRKLGKIGTT